MLRLLCSKLLWREFSLSNKPLPVHSVLYLLKGCVVTVVERGKVLFNSWYLCGAGLPFGCFHAFGTREWRAQEVPWSCFIRATWPNIVRWRLVIILHNGWEVRCRISTLVICSNQWTSQMHLKHHWSNASILTVSDWEAYRAIGLTQMS